MKTIAIIGSGSWGVALGIHLAKYGNKVKIWSFDKEEADLINVDKKCKFLPDINLPDGIECFLDFETTINNSDIIFNKYLFKHYPRKQMRKKFTQLRRYSHR